jgi:Flp pilus assembly protein TadD
VRLAERVCCQSGSPDPAALDALAAALAQNGQFDRAAETARQAAQLAESHGRSAQAEAIRGRLALFQKGRPYRE